MTEKTTVYVATEPLFIGRDRAHNPGDTVPAENVETHGWRDQVTERKVDVDTVSEPPATSVKAILAEVGDDKAKAAAALEAERAGENRVTLVDGLEAVLAS